MEQRFQAMCSQHFYDGLLLATVTDRDGVIVLKCKSENAKEELLEPTLATTFAVTNNQASKLGLGPHQGMISVYDLYQLIQWIDHPLMIHLVAHTSANTAIFMNLGQELLRLIKPLIQSMLNERQNT
ncbi:Ragulator complex protein LAMTOR3 [Sporodiniella umbellata]|nr:Ragulator complex protein LAMTOR3 [Sporodiniella umbellata]